MLVHDLSELKSRAPMPWVLLVADPAGVSPGLCGAICMAGYALVVRSDASSALEAAYEEPPGVILCDVDLPDGDGYSFARWVRASDRLGATPLILLSARTDLSWKLQGFQAGADACVGKDRDARDIVSQVSAFLRMSARLRRRRAELDAAPPARDAIVGDASHVAIATVLSVLDMERRSGTFELSTPEGRTRLEMVRGYAIGGSTGGQRVKPLDALRSMLAAPAGRFAFRPMPVRAMGALPEPARIAPVRELLAEAQRLHDEGSVRPPAPAAA